MKLYDLAQDPFERRDLSGARPKEARRLFRKLNDWLDVNVATRYLPALNPDYDAAREARHRPFVDLRKKYLSEARAIRSSTSDPRFNLTTPNQTMSHLAQAGEVDGFRPTMAGRMVRTEHYKYCVLSRGQQRESLVDMQKDPGETVNLAADPKYREVLRPATEEEGMNLPLKASVAGAMKGREHALRDPGNFVDVDGRVYLLYSVAGEAGIGIAELRNQP